MTTANGRTADHDIDPLFLERWSPRAFDGSAISDATLHSLFEAARWAPSAFNAQPWRFVYARRDTPEWERLLGGLIEFNRGWAKHASLLVYVASDTLMGDGKPSHSHSFDAGAAWALLALQATRLGLHAHGMTGVEFDAVRAILALPERYRIEAAVAVGRLGDKSILPEALQARETPSSRKPQGELVFEGRFPG